MKQIMEKGQKNMNKIKNVKNILQKQNVTNKTFSYQKGNVSLNFTLRVDTKQELKDWIEIVKQSLEDVGEELQKLNHNTK